MNRYDAVLKGHSSDRSQGPREIEAEVKRKWREVEVRIDEKRVVIIELFARRDGLVSIRARDGTLLIHPEANGLSVGVRLPAVVAKA